MARNAASNTSPSSSPLVLAETDRVLLDLLRDGIAERSGIRRARVGTRALKPEDTKRARLEQNQERLETMLEEALARPAINRALRDRDFEIAELREAGDQGVWRDVVPAINAIRPSAERQADEQRREAIAEAARVLVVTQNDQQRGRGKTWLDVLEERVRASIAGDGPREGVVAKRLVEWTEAALSVVPEPVAAGARIALVEHAYGSAAGAGEDDRREPVRLALRAILEEDKSGRYARPSHDEAAADGQASRPREVNRIWFDDASPTPHGERQVADFIAAVRSAEPPPETGLLTRLRGYFGKRKEDAASTQEAAGDDDGIPNALKKRYAIHVSDNGKTIELFEAGAKTAAITLDAKSISTPHNEGAVIADMIMLARDRGWQTLKVAGTAEFKDAVWLEASKAGLVAQHEPSSAVKAAFAKWDRERPANEIQQAPPAQGAGPAAQSDLARAFASKSPEERLADPRLRNAQLELMIGIRTAEKELKRPIAEMPEVAKALTAAVREQLASGKVFDAPFVKPSPPKPTPRQVANPKIEADRIPSPRP